MLANIQYGTQVNGLMTWLAYCYYQFGQWTSLSNLQELVGFEVHYLGEIGGYDPIDEVPAEMQIIGF